MPDTISFARGVPSADLLPVAELESELEPGVAVAEPARLRHLHRPAEQALEWGLLNRVVPADQVLDTALELARAIASANSRPLGMTAPMAKGWRSHRLRKRPVPAGAAEGMAYCAGCIATVATGAAVGVSKTDRACRICSSALTSET